MPQRPIEPKYRELIAAYAEGRSAVEVFREIEEIANAQGWTDAPSQRSVERYHAKHMKLPPLERLESSLFRWPDSMEAGVLPWEASRAALDLLRYRLRTERG